MKTITFSIFLLSSLACFAQKEHTTYQVGDFLNLVDGKTEYSGVVQVEGTTGAILYSRAKAWIYDTFKSGKDVIEIDDRENQKLTGKGIFKVPWLFSGVVVFFKINIAAKGNKYRYEFSDVYTESTYQPKSPVESWGKGKVLNRESNRNMLIDIDKEFKKLALSLEKHMMTKAKDEDF